MKMCMEHDDTGMLCKNVVRTQDEPNQMKKLSIEGHLTVGRYVVHYFGDNPCTISRINKNGVFVPLGRFKDRESVEIEYTVYSAEEMAAQNDLAKYLISGGFLHNLKEICSSGERVMRECADSISEILERVKGK